MLAEAAFVPNTPISSSAMNSDLSDIATGLSTAITKDGQTVITQPIRFASGTVGLPGIAFVADTDCGVYRIGANNLGISVNATKILDIATTGLTVVGTVSPSTTVTNANGTEALPSYTFASDPDSGVYRIGANNIGVGVNATKILDISTAGLNVVGTISSNGTAFAPLPQAVAMINGTITVTANSPGANDATVAIKTLAGSDPSASDPVFFVFRNVTAATGDYVIVQATAAMSLVLSSGSLYGTTSTVAFNLWFAVFNDGGTLRLAGINCKSATGIYPLQGWNIASAVIGSGGAADSAQVFYTTGTTVTAKAYATIGYAYWASGLGTAGNWDTAPTRIHLHGINDPLPRQPIQNNVSTKSSVSTIAVTAATYADITGMSVTLSNVTNAANAVQLDWVANLACDTLNTAIAIVPLRGSTIILQGDAASNRTRAAQVGYIEAAVSIVALTGSVLDLTPGSGSVTWKMQMTGDRTTNYFINRSATDSDTNLFFRTASTLTATEIMA